MFHKSCLRLFQSPSGVTQLSVWLVCSVCETGSTCNHGKIGGAAYAKVLVRLVVKIQFQLQGCTFGYWVKLVSNQGLPHTKPQWRPVRGEKKGQKSPRSHQCLISKPVFNISIMMFPQLERKGASLIHNACSGVLECCAFLTELHKAP